MGSISMQSVQAVPGSRGERLSAIVDGEMSGDGHPNRFFSDFDRADRAAWSNYHLIGDVLRSDDLAVNPAASEAFMSRFAESLDAEPHVLAPAASSSVRLLSSLRRRVVPGLAVAAAAATLTWIVVPQMHGIGVGQGGAQVASLQASGSGDVQRVAMASVPQEGNIIRDAQLDQYLEAHQQFAQQPVMMDSTPLIRSAALTTQRQ